MYLQSGRQLEVLQLRETFSNWAFSTEMTDKLYVIDLSLLHLDWYLAWVASNMSTQNYVFTLPSLLYHGVCVIICYYMITWFNKIGQLLILYNCIILKQF